MSQTRGSARDLQQEFKTVFEVFYPACVSFHISQ